MTIWVPFPPSPFALLFFAALSGSLVVWKQAWRFLLPPLHKLILGLSISWRLLVLQINWIAVKWVCYQTQIPLFVFLKTHRHHTWRQHKENKKQTMSALDVVLTQKQHMIQIWWIIWWLKKNVSLTQSGLKRTLKSIKHKREAGEGGWEGNEYVYMFITVL